MQRRKSEKESVEPLDVAEQEKIANDLLSEALQSSQRMRFLYFVVYIFIACIFVALIVQGCIDPLLLSHQRVFRAYISHFYFQIHYVVSAICFAVIAFVLKVSEISSFLHVCNKNLMSINRTKDRWCLELDYLLHLFV